MKRYTILSKYAHKQKMKWGNLFQDHRSFKTEKYAKAVIRKMKEYRPELDFKVRTFTVTTCHHCKQDLK